MEKRPDIEMLFVNAHDILKNRNLAIEDGYLVGEAYDAHCSANFKEALEIINALLPCADNYDDPAAEKALRFLVKVAKLKVKSNI